MKEALLLILGLGWAITLSAQEPFSCKEAATKFQQDLDTGAVKIYEAGPAGWSRTYERLALRRFGVRVVKTDLFGLHDWMHCYNEWSIPYVRDSLGVDFDALSTEAQQLDRSGKGDRLAEMITPWDSVESFMYQRIDPALYREYLQGGFRKHLELYCHIYIDEAGAIYDLYESGVRGSPLDSAMKAVASQIPFRAKPALLDGQPTAGKVQCFFRFDEASASMYRSVTNTE